MSLPVLHSFTGYSIYRLAKRGEPKQSWKLAFYCMVLANLADFDFIPGMLLNNPDFCHRGFSHSLGAALFCGISAVLFYCWKRKEGKLSVFCISLAAYYSHIILDFFGGTSTPMPLFWPFSAAEYYWPLWSGRGLPHFAGSSTISFLNYFLSTRFFERLIIEVAIVLLLVGLLRLVKRLRDPQIDPVPAFVSLAISFILLLTMVAVNVLAG